jgi:hypothetical protein
MRRCALAVHEHHRQRAVCLSVYVIGVHAAYGIGAIGPGTCSCSVGCSALLISVTQWVVRNRMAQSSRGAAAERRRRIRATRELGFLHVHRLVRVQVVTCGPTGTCCVVPVALAFARLQWPGQWHGCQALQSPHHLLTHQRAQPVDLHTVLIHVMHCCEVHWYERFRNEFQFLPDSLLQRIGLTTPVRPHRCASGRILQAA